MGAGSEVKEPRDMGSILLALIIAGIVVAAGALIYVGYANSRTFVGGAPYAIEAGDTVTLNYIGRFSDGRIFDTSIWYVASDDANYSKSLTFVHRSNDTYSPFSMTAGNYGAGGTIRGFALGVLGLHAGDYKVIEVAPEDGYPVNQNMLRTVNLTETIPVKEEYTVSAFQSAFSTTPVPMATLAHFFWKWEVLVASVSGDVVTVLNQPTVGSSVYPFGDPTGDDPSGWEVRVLSYDPSADGGKGQIVLRHMLSAEDVYHVKGKDASGNLFVISAFDSMNETFQIHRSDSKTSYNGEISGRPLFFEVTIIKAVPVTS